MKVKISPIGSFELFAQACIGALAGALTAMLIAGFTLHVGGRPAVMPEPLLDWNLQNVLFKPREKGFFFLALLLGTIGAYLASLGLWRIKERYLWAILLSSIPATTFFAYQVIQLDDYKLLLCATTMLMLAFVAYHYHHSIRFTAVVDKPAPDDISPSVYLALLLPILLILIPRSFTEVAARIGMEMHVVSTLIGPALYFLNGNLLPGVDYYTQYSIGEPWLYSFIMGKNADAAILNYTILVITVTGAFFAQFLLLTRWLYQSWYVASLVTFTFLIMLFHGDNHFFDPSSSVLRYPLLGISAWCFAAWIARPSSLGRTFLLSNMIALSLFFNTETGIITAGSIALSTLLLKRPVFPALWRLICLGMLSFALTILLLVMVFGLRSLHVDFMVHLIEPLILFGKYGFGGWPIAWNMQSLNWFYNVVSPGIVLATLALIIHTNNSDENQPRRAVLAFFAMVGLGMMAKFINMSIIALWEMNALGFMVVFGWWGKVFIAKYNASDAVIPYTKFKIQGSAAAVAMTIFFAFYLIAFADDPRNSAPLGLRSWASYPSLVRSLVKKKYRCHDFSCVANRPDQSDVLLIQERTKQGELVAIIDLYDWTYLVGAHRPPLMLFTPSGVIFTKQQLLESLKRLQTVPYLFLPKNMDASSIAFGKDELMTDFWKNFHNNYTKEKEGVRLVAWKRINHTLP